MKIINFIGILLILLTSTIGNKIAPGRNCTFVKNDTVRAFGPTKYAENDKYGFWVFLDHWNKMDNLNCVMYFSDNKRNGWLTEFQGDSLQTKSSEIHYLNDTIDGEVKIYNSDGKCNQIMTYKQGEVIKQHFFIPEDYAIFEYVEGKKPDNIDSAFYDVMLSDEEKILFFLEDFWNPMKEDDVVIFNSWTNKITTIIIVICCILMILNFYNYVRHKN